MGLKNYWNKLVGTVGGVDDDDEFETEGYEEDDEVETEPRQPRRAPAMPAARRAGMGDSGYAQPVQPMKMVIVEPESFDDSQGIADYLRERKPVVINFESTAPDISKRVVDFVSGATYALDGTIQKVGKNIFLCVPSNVTVDRGKPDYSAFGGAPLAWNTGGQNNSSSNAE